MLIIGLDSFLKNCSIVDDDDSSVTIQKCTRQFAVNASVLYEQAGFNTFHLCKTSVWSYHISGSIESALENNGGGSGVCSNASMLRLECEVGVSSGIK